MAIQVFYSWQSDLDARSNSQIIERALKNAISRLNRARAPGDPRRFVLDRDTMAVPGSPDIAASILEKIDRCDIFVADLSFVAKTSIYAQVKGRRRRKSKRLPNSNVMLEYGYALKAKGDRRLVSIINQNYGDVTELPFNLSHKRTSIAYNLNNTAQSKTRKVVQTQLEKQLFRELNSIAQSEALYAQALMRVKKTSRKSKIKRRSS